MKKVISPQPGDFLIDSFTNLLKKFPRKEEFHNSFDRRGATDVPALVLEGEFDPVTPPRYGEEVVKTLPNGRLLTLRGQGHNVIGVGCMPKLFAQFIETADAKALDATCLDTLRLCAAVHRLLRLGAVSAPCSTQGPTHDRRRTPAQDLPARARPAPVIAVEDVSFTAHDGEITGLLGPNGAGKTTTLRMLYTLMTPEPGSVLVDGIDVADDADRRAPPPGRAAGRARRLQAPDRAREHRLLRRSCTACATHDIAERTAGAVAGAGDGRRPRPPDRGLLAGPAHQDRDRARAGARPAQRDPRRADQRPGRDDHARPARLPAASCAREGRCVIFSSHIMQEVAALCDRIVVIAHGHGGGRRAPPDELRAQTGEDNLEDAFVKADRFAKRDCTHEPSQLLDRDAQGTDAICPATAAPC